MEVRKTELTPPKTIKMQMTHRQPPFFTLPIEIITLIFEFAPNYRFLACLMLTCKYFANIIPTVPKVKSSDFGVIVPRNYQQKNRQHYLAGVGNHLDQNNFSPQDDKIVFCDQKRKLWLHYLKFGVAKELIFPSDAEKEDYIVKLRKIDNYSSVLMHDNYYLKPRFSEKGNLIYVMGKNNVYVWNGEGEFLYSLRHPYLNSVMVSKSEKYIITSAQGIKLWDAKTGAFLSARGENHAIGIISPEDKYIISSSRADMRFREMVKVWEIEPNMWDVGAKEETDVCKYNPKISRGYDDCYGVGHYFGKKQMCFTQHGTGVVLDRKKGRIYEIIADTFKWKDIKGDLGKISLHSICYSPDGNHRFIIQEKDKQTIIMIKDMVKKKEVKLNFGSSDDFDYKSIRMHFCSTMKYDLFMVFYKYREMKSLRVYNLLTKECLYEVDDPKMNSASFTRHGDIVFGNDNGIYIKQFARQPFIQMNKLITQFSSIYNKEANEKKREPSLKSRCVMQ